MLQQSSTGLVGGLSYGNSQHNNVVDDCRANARMKKTYYIYYKSKSQSIIEVSVKNIHY